MAIADLAGGDWPTRSRTAAVVLTAEAEHADAGASMGVRLLADLRDLFAIRAQTGAPLLSDDGHLQFYTAMFTDTILGALHSMAEAPWNNYYGRQISARDLSNLLSTFDIESQNVRIGEQVRKGYRSQGLWDAWHRYV